MGSEGKERERVAREGMARGRETEGWEGRGKGGKGCEGRDGTGHGATGRKRKEGIGYGTEGKEKPGCIVPLHSYPRRGLTGIP